MKNVALIVIVAILLMSGCTSEKEAKKALESESYTHIKYTGYHFFACSKDDFFHTGFKARNSKNKVVEGTVCSGLIFKGSTIRY